MKMKDDPTTFRMLVGSLQYLTMTMLELSYYVNQTSQFLQTPRLALFWTNLVICHLATT